MPLLIQYLIKLTISFAIVWLFYQFILRRLTFYNSNRWFLLTYTLLSFFIPFVNISSLVESKSNSIIEFVPSVHQYTTELEDATNCPTPIWSTYDKWDFIGFGLMIVAAFLFLRFVISYFSLLKIQRKAKLISKDGVKIYQVDENIIPFSFGRSIFINSKLHTDSELEEIIRHEFVHVRQNHTVDIIWAEILCILNWYNPFAWLLKRSIRQNLEFIADNKVIENGINKKQYQYLLLKVIGNKQFSIATQFNFSSLKKRIAMMNKSKSAKRQLGRFLFLLPVLAVILLSFRHSLKQTSFERTFIQPSITDTIPDVTVLNSKGYYIDIKDDNGNCTVVVKDKNKKEVKRVLLIEWNAKDDYYENLYGEILSSSKEIIEERIKSHNPNITSVKVKDNIATITLRDGKTEVYTLSIKDQKKAFEERCGVATTTPVEVAVTNDINEVTEVRLATTIEKPISSIVTTKPDLKEVVVVGHPVTVSNVNTTVAPNVQNDVNVVSEARLSTAPTAVIEEVIRSEVDIIVTIKNTTKPEDLEALIKKFKEKGYELKFTNKNYDDGVLTELSGTVKYNGSSSSFSFSEFDQATIAVYRDGDDVYFRIYTGKRRTAS